jgi:hypothetical protein
MLTTMPKIIFTHHALLRLKERKLNQKLVEQSILHPTSHTPGKEANSIEYVYKWEHRTITTVVKPTREGDLLVVSTWLDPPFMGTKDYKKQEYYRSYKKASFWGKVWLEFKKIIGI